jgi:hypothetical protein
MQLDMLGSESQEEKTLGELTSYKESARSLRSAKDRLFF